MWLGKTPPVAAKVGILRSDFKEPCWGVARYDAYVGKKKGGEVTAMWIKLGDVMIAKCAEALGLRKAFPQELSGLYTSDEMEQATPVDVAPAAQPTTVVTPRLEEIAPGETLSIHNNGNEKVVVKTPAPVETNAAAHGISGEGLEDASAATCSNTRRKAGIRICP